MRSIALFADVSQVEISDMRPGDDGVRPGPRLRRLLGSMGVQVVDGLAPFDGGAVTVVAEPQAALVAAIAFDPALTPEENSASLLEAIARVRTASVAAGGDLAPAIEALRPAPRCSPCWPGRTRR